MRGLRRSLATALVVAGCGLGLAPAASAYHDVGSCGEVGEWSSAASSRINPPQYAQAMGVLAYVGYVPPYSACFDSGRYQPSAWSSQHTSLHARRNDYGECLETVGQRWSFGTLFMYGYNCRAGGPANVHQIDGYNNPWMYLWQAGNGSYDWAYSYFRYDTNQWVYLGNTRSPCCRYYYSWLESSGYNETAPRSTVFRGFTETRSDGTSGTSNFPCPTSENFDAHQVQIPNKGGQAANTAWFPSTANC